jgi:hypothetical protein
MTKAIEEAKPPMSEPSGDCRAELLASLEREEDDAKAGRVKRMSVAELKMDLRADFERITGNKIL